MKLEIKFESKGCQKICFKCNFAIIGFCNTNFTGSSGYLTKNI